MLTGVLAVVEWLFPCFRFVPNRDDIIRELQALKQQTREQIEERESENRKSRRRNSKDVELNCLRVTESMYELLGAQQKLYRASDRVSVLIPNEAERQSAGNLEELAQRALMSADQLQDAMNWQRMSIEMVTRSKDVSNHAGKVRTSKLFAYDKSLNFA